MSDILLFWMGLTIGFIILELLTATFYGLSLAFASVIVWFYIFLSQDMQFEIIHAVIFAIGSALFAYFLPNMLHSRSPDTPQGSDRYIGEKRSVKKSGGDLRISLDGVEYLIESDDEILAGEKVEVTGHKGASMKVKKVIEKK